MERTIRSPRADTSGRGATDSVAVESRNALAWLSGVLREVGSTCSAGRGGKWQCPAHAHAGCTARDVASALGLSLDQLRRPPRISPQRWVRVRRLAVGFPAAKAGGSPRSEGYRHERYHHYGRPGGPQVRLERLRHPVTGDKAIEWWARNDRGEWVPGLLGTREADLPLYREHEVIAAVALGETVLLVESESSADALICDGWYATTWAGGAGAPPVARLAELLGDHPHVVIIGDADDAGRACVARLSQALPRAAVRFSDRDREDARDLHTRLGARGVIVLVTAAAGHTPAAA